MTHDQIIKMYGSPTKAAQALGVTLQTLRNWQKRIPHRSQGWIQHVTSGKLKANGKE